MSFFKKIGSGILKGLSAVTGFASKVLPLPIVGSVLGGISNVTGNIADNINAKQKAAQQAVLPEVPPTTSVNAPQSSGGQAQFAAFNPDDYTLGTVWYKKPVTYIVGGVVLLLVILLFTLTGRRRR